MSNGEHDATRRISVSEELLRAIVAEMELRLTNLIRDGLSAKADRSLVEENSRRLGVLERDVVRRDGPLMVKVETYEQKVDAMARGEFTEAQDLAIDRAIDVKFEARQTKGFSTRERWLAAIAMVIVIAQFMLSIYVSLAQAQPSPEPAGTTTEVVP